MGLDVCPCCPRWGGEREILCRAYALEAVMRLPYLGSGGGDIRGFHNDTCTFLWVVAGRLRQGRVLVIGSRPAIGMVADEGVWVPRAGDPEVGLGRADERGHARKRARGNPENLCAVVLPPDCANTL